MGNHDYRLAIVTGLLIGSALALLGRFLGLM